MQALSLYIKKINYPIALFALLGIRILFFQANLAEALILLGYLVYDRFKWYVEFTKKQQEVVLPEQKLKDLETMITTIAMKNNKIAPDLSGVKRFF